jgi:hypothetical protein
LDADTLGNYIPYVFDGNYETHASPLTGNRALRMSTELPAAGAPSVALLTPEIHRSLAAGDSVDAAIVLANYGNVGAAYSVSIPDYTTAAANTYPPNYNHAYRHIEHAKGESNVSRGDASPLDNFGNEDAYGYAWMDSREPDGPVYQFTDISDIGTDIGLARDDTASAPIQLPWHFPFYGKYFDKLSVSSNGFLCFWTASKDFYNDPLSTPTDPYYMIAPFWTDLDARYGNGHFYAHFDSLSDRFIIQWDEIKHWPYYQGETYTFESILYHDGTIEFIYEEMNSILNDNTTGIKGGFPGESRELVYDDDFIESNLLVRIYRPQTENAACKILLNPRGIIPPMDSVLIPMRLVNYSNSNDNFYWNVLIETSDATAAALTVDVALYPENGIVFDPQLVIRPEGDGVMLSWRQHPTPFYCIYSGTPADSALTYLEATVTDTFYLIPDINDTVRRFHVRLCDGN